MSGFSPAAGRERPVKSNKKLMNIEHRTPNVQRRIMYSIYLKKIKWSDSALRHLSAAGGFDIQYSAVLRFAFNVSYEVSGSGVAKFWRLL